MSNFSTDKSSKIELTKTTHLDNKQAYLNLKEANLVLTKRIFLALVVSLARRTYLLNVQTMLNSARQINSIHRARFKTIR